MIQQTPSSGTVHEHESQSKTPPVLIEPIIDISYTVLLIMLSFDWARILTLAAKLLGNLFRAACLRTLQSRIDPPNGFPF